MNKICAIHQPHYLPYMGYIDKIFQSDVFVFLDTVQFVRRGWQNRNKIRTVMGWQWLTIPVRRVEREQKIYDIKIDATRVSWKRKHLRSIELNYSRAKHFEKHSPRLQKLYLGTNTDSLSLFNINIIKWLSAVLIPSWKGKFVIASEYEGVSNESTGRLIDLCKKFDCDTYFAGTGGKNYMNMDAFSDAGITVAWQRFKEAEHEQCYAPFLPGMGCLDYILKDRKSVV